MNKDQQKVVQYLNEAHATEHALVRVLQSQLAMTPRGSDRTGLEKHLEETRDHAARVGDRLEALGQGSNPLMAVVGLAETAVGQALALGKTPIDMLRGSGGEEKILKNAKDACATEALEIATYLAIERLARDLDDEKTAKLAASIRADEERMLKRVREELPALTDAVVRAEIDGQASYDVTKTGAADAARATTREAKGAARKTADRAKRTTRQVRRVPGAARAEGTVKGAVASADDLPIATYDDLNVDDITAKLPELSQVDLAKVEAYERKQDNRSTVLDRVSSLRGNEPWTGYDEQTVDEIVSALRDSDDDTSRQVRDYERAHKNRTSVLKATERSLASVS